MHNPMHSRQVPAKHFQHLTLEAIASNIRVVGSGTYFRPFGLFVKMAAWSAFELSVGDAAKGRYQLADVAIHSNETDPKTSEVLT